MSHWFSSSGLLSGFSLVEVMAAGCIHQVVEGKNPKTTRSMVFISCWGYGETPPVPPLDDATLDHGTFHESLASSKILQLSLTIAVESIMTHNSPSAKMNTIFSLHVAVLVLWRGVFTAESLFKGGHWCDRKDLWPLSGFVLYQPLALSGNPACSPKHAHPSAFCASLAKHSANCLSC